MIEALQQQFKELPAEERLAMLVGYLQLARRELDLMTRDSREMGEQTLASGLTTGSELVGDIIDGWYDDIAEEVADSVEEADALVRKRKRDGYRSD